MGIFHTVYRLNDWSNRIINNGKNHDFDVFALLQRRPVRRSSWIQEEQGCPPLTLCLPLMNLITTAWATPPPSPLSNGLNATPCTWGGSATDHTGWRVRWRACLHRGRRYRRGPVACSSSPPSCSTGPTWPDTQWALRERTATRTWRGLVADSPESVALVKGNIHLKILTITYFLMQTLHVLPQLQPVRKHKHTVQDPF